MTLTIDVAIPAHNNISLTERCLARLGCQTVPHEVTVYDDASTDGTAQRLAREWPRIHLISGSQSLGFARAANAAAKAGGADVIVLLNNDVECREDFLERLVAPLEEDPELGSVAALMLQPGEELIDSIGLTCDITLAAFPRLHGLPCSSADRTEPVLVGPAGTAAAYRRSAWNEVGGLDESITAYMEDFDLALRLRAAGWQTTAAPSAAGVHVGSASYGHRSVRQREHGGFARGYLLRRYGVMRGRAAVRALATESIVVAGDATISRDFAALKGRLAGYRAARSLPKRQLPPAEAIDRGIGFRRSLALRRGVYERPPADTPTANSKRASI
jgi:N-acetylglucosaminyl-diphospho-decaprenol L-rhamnosyltransferase